MDDDERRDERTAARERLAALEKEWTPPSSLYAECVRYADEVEGGTQILLSAVLYSEQWSRPPLEDIKATEAAQVWDHAMHLKTMGEYAIARAYQITGDKARQAFHTRKAEIGYPRLFWPSDAFLEHAAAEMQRARRAP